MNEQFDYLHLLAMNIPFTKDQVIEKLSEFSPLIFEYITAFNGTSACAELDFSIAANRSDEIKGIWIYRKISKLGFTSIEPFPFLPHSILFLKYPDIQKPQKKQAYQIEIVNELIEGLPAYDNLTISLTPSWQDHLPFLLKNLPQTTKYTYILDLHFEESELWDKLDSNRRRHIKAAKKEGHLVEKSTDLSFLYKIKNETDDKIRMSKPDFVRLFSPLIESGTCELLILKNKEGHISSSVLLAHDKETSYYLIGGNSPKKSTSSSFSLLLWYSILHCKERSTSFDFEGSVIPSIERFFRSFGGRLTPYHVIQHTPNKILEVYRKTKRLF